MDRGTLSAAIPPATWASSFIRGINFSGTPVMPPQTVAAPHLGSVIARTLGPLNPAVPPFINIGQRFDVGEGEELKSFTTAGFLGSELRPI
ncbi:MAG: hypothetical protein U1G07_12250 [Verrucomicrobiota bacterium]